MWRSGKMKSFIKAIISRLFTKKSYGVNVKILWHDHNGKLKSLSKEYITSHDNFVAVLYPKGYEVRIEIKR